MNSREYFKEIGYVGDGYVRAVKEYELANRHSVLKENYRPRHMASAAGILCEMLVQLSNDDNFYKGLEEFSKELEENRESVREIFSDFGKFLEVEYKILVDARIQPDVARKLVTEMSRSMRMLEGLPNISHIINLKERIAECAKAICEVEEELTRPDEPMTFRKQFFRSLRPIGIGLTIVGGVTIITSNAIAATTVPIFLGSVGAGAATVGGGLIAMS